MLRGRPGAEQGPSTDMAVVAADRPRKKLSFREPEIMGYYMQMKQGVTSRFSRKGKSKPPSKPVREAAPEEAEVLAEAVDEEELELSSSDGQDFEKPLTSLSSNMAFALPSGVTGYSGWVRCNFCRDRISKGSGLCHLGRREGQLCSNLSSQSGTETAQCSNSL
ncbi:Carboxyl-terminal PDZ ligand of neuronal nitric oxide synthase protein [Homalodisca vitripennis]|nr:Carboxyl-terminal PDZ ligand of neuronal nitric oxide synthase protein [Homalodisca vitripennis]